MGYWLPDRAMNVCLYKSKNVNEFFEIVSKRANEYILEVKYKDKVVYLNYKELNKLER